MKKKEDWSFEKVSLGIENVKINANKFSFCINFNTNFFKGEGKMELPGIEFEKLIHLFEKNTFSIKIENFDKVLMYCFFYYMPPKNGLTVVLEFGFSYLK